MKSLYPSVLITTLSFCLIACSGRSGGSSKPTAASSKPSSITITSSTPAASSTPASSTTSSTSTSSSASVLNATVDAGKDQTVVSGAMVNLTALAAGDTLAPFTYQWTQIGGTAIALTNSNTATASFTAPAAIAPFIGLFEVIATDKQGGTCKDSIAINISSQNAISRYEAEAAALTGNLSIATSLSGYSGTGYITGYATDNDATTWTITVATAAYYKVDIGFQVDQTAKGFTLVIDGTTLSGTMTSSDKLFHSVSAGRQWLSAGSHTFVVKGGWHFYNIDYLELTQVAAGLVPQQLNSAPVDINASAKTKALKKYLNNTYTHNTISGQQDAAELDIVFALSGKRPVIYAYDLASYSSLSVNSMGAPASQTENYLAKIQANSYIASLIWHWHSPMHAKNTVNPCPSPQVDCWWNSFYTAHTNFDLSTALADTNSAEYKAIIADIDLIAVQLKKLQVADIPVLWRPLHEADGTWFWWGAKGPESFKQLWRVMHNRLTNHHQLHNLIWVWTNETFTWYPGDDVVDVVGIDAYPSDKHDTLSGIWEKMLERFDGHKLIALTEFGGIPFINEMHAKGIWWAWFASWSGDLGPNKMTSGEVNAIYNSSEVITLDEVVMPAP